LTAGTIDPMLAEARGVEAAVRPIHRGATDQTKHDSKSLYPFAYGSVRDGST
jgi:hypothetical protein